MEERKAYFTVQARELVEMGWVRKGTEEPKPVAKKTVKKAALAPVVEPTGEEEGSK